MLLGHKVLPFLTVARGSLRLTGAGWPVVSRFLEGGLRPLSPGTQQSVVLPAPAKEGWGVGRRVGRDFVFVIGTKRNTDTTTKTLVTGKDPPKWCGCTGMAHQERGLHWDSMHHLDGIAVAGRLRAPRGGSRMSQEATQRPDKGWRVRRAGRQSIRSLVLFAQTGREQPLFRAETWVGPGAGC